jgi:hypothetical protein
LIKRETELKSNRSWKACQPIKRVSKPNQLARLLRFLLHQNPLYAKIGI